MPDVRAHRVLASISRVAVLETLREAGRPMGVRELTERVSVSIRPRAATDLPLDASTEVR